MRLFLLIILTLTFPELGCSKKAVDYTGIWKTNCTDYYGVQIKPVSRELYSITFCGLRGCFEPGTWMPNSRIAGDTSFKISSNLKIGIRKTVGDPYFDYQKCTSDPTWVATKEEREKPKEPATPEACRFTEPTDSEEVTIGWLTDVRVTTQFGGDEKEQQTTVGAFRPLVSLSGSSLKETSGSTIRNGQRYWAILNPAENQITLSNVDSFLDHMGEDHCVYSASTTNTSSPKWSLLSSKPLDKVFRSPTKKDNDLFRSLNSTCIDQGDYPEGKTPPCSRPGLLGVSDIDHDGKPEYWATEPYKWDTGLTIWEVDEKLIPILEICIGCSD